jgi:hypothetical protein
MAVPPLDVLSEGRAHYSEGHLVPGKAGTSEDPKPVAGKVGTQITVCKLVEWMLTVGRGYLL